MEKEQYSVYQTVDGLIVKISDQYYDEQALAWLITQNTDEEQKIKYGVALQALRNRMTITIEEGNQLTLDFS